MGKKQLGALFFCSLIFVGLLVGCGRPCKRPIEVQGVPSEIVPLIFKSGQTIGFSFFLGNFTIISDQMVVFEEVSTDKRALDVYAENREKISQIGNLIEEAIANKKEVYVYGDMHS